MAWDAELIQITTRAKSNGYHVYTYHPRFQVRARPSYTGRKGTTVCSTSVCVCSVWVRCGALPFGGVFPAGLSPLCGSSAGCGFNPNLGLTRGTGLTLTLLK